ncbi:MAG: three-Cys-motif partner protein TcmP [Nitrospinota bacterium]|nr:three-Cys-motif partner protein TcmP [Nitrospinota bacterium]
MTVPKKTLWQLDDHTRAKHEILHKYLEAWLPILKSFPRVIYVDGFCGPGRYDKGEPGSPIIALEVAKQHTSQLPDHIDFYFIDKKKDHIEYLKSEIPKLPSNIRVEIKQGEFREQFEPILKNLELSRNSFGANITPSFIFIDPFGYSGIPFSMVERILNLKSCEVFINFMVSYINRFLSHPNDSITENIVEIYGTNECLRIATEGNDRIQELRALYQSQLRTHAKYIRFFEMKNKKDSPIYFLFFATNSIKGFIKMKEAMWKVDDTGLFSFSDATNPSQSTLFGKYLVSDVINDILKKYAGKKNVRCVSVKESIEGETAFLEKHMKEALRNMEEEKRVVVEQIKLNGKKRIAKSFPDDAILSFL